MEAGDVLGLRHDGIVDLLAAVAHVDGPEAGEGVDVLLAVHVTHYCPVGAGHDHRRERVTRRDLG